MRWIRNLIFIVCISMEMVSSEVKRHRFTIGGGGVSV